MNEIFAEIELYYFSSLSYKEKYTRFYKLLERVCKQLTAEEPVDFSNLFSRLYYLCAQRKVKPVMIDVFRIHARHIMQEGTFCYTEEDYQYDVKALCETLSALIHIPIPTRLEQLLPQHWRALPQTHYESERQKRIRMVVENWNEQYIYGYDENHPSDTPLQVDYTEEFAYLQSLLFQGAQLNLLSVRSDESGVLQAEQIVLEPDYLIDISSLSACLTNYGDTPLNYLYYKFRPQESTHHILLGNAANQFLDDCINSPKQAPASFDTSIQKAFRNDLLAYCTTPQIDAEYFRKAKEQFEHIQLTLKRLEEAPSYRFDKEKIILEPSFLCESLGLQGRMDLLQTDGHNLIELKSGKADEWNGKVRSKPSHALQMALYKEVLYYNLNIPREQVNSYLFYSTYPKLYAERSAKGQIQKAIALRNKIVAQEIALKNGKSEELLETLTPDSFNERNDQSRLWLQYQYPQIASWLRPFHTASLLEKAYFHHFLSFIEKEQFLAKTGDSQLDASRGFSDTWNAPLATKKESGNILTALNLQMAEGIDGVDCLTLEIPAYDESFLPNFRKGDIVLLYERNKENDRVTNQQVFRGSIQNLNDKAVVVKLRYPQKNKQTFASHSLYAIEHDFMDSSFNTLYRGLYAFLTAPQERRDLLLCQRTPRVHTGVTLTGSYHNEQIDHIVLQAKQAADYFLLVGPPGTGKTSVALKSMVQEFYTHPTNQLLFLSYTNRAVDEICEMLENIPGNPPYLRIGSSLSCDERFQPRLLQNFTQTCLNRKEIIQGINRIRIIVGTTSSISGKPELFKLKQFQIAIVDEASQIIEPQLLNILCSTNEQGQCAVEKFILIGDPKQLPAVVQQTPLESTVTQEDLRAIGLTDRRNSLFERLYHRQQFHPQTGILAMLNRQGRMHPAVNDFPNQEFYEGVLEIVPVEHQLAELEFVICPEKAPNLFINYPADMLKYMRLVANTRVAFLPSPFPPLEDSNKINRHEAQTIARLVQSIYELCRINELPFHAGKRIGIIVPFRNQIALISKALRALQLPETDEITIDTVERYQGSQRDIILFSTTISQPYQLDILSTPIQDNGRWIDRRLNVALTRAKKQIFIIGNPTILKNSPIYRKLMKQFLVPSF